MLLNLKNLNSIASCFILLYNLQLIPCGLCFYCFPMHSCLPRRFPSNFHQGTQHLPMKRSICMLSSFGRYVTGQKGPCSFLQHIVLDPQQVLANVKLNQYRKSAQSLNLTADPWTIWYSLGSSAYTITASVVSKSEDPP